jgi:very-short-patch-repair endonuclease
MEKNKKYWEIKNCLVCNKQFGSLISRCQRFCSNKCSTNFTGKDKNRINKIKKTKLNRYGNENYVNVKKAKDTCLKKYGVDNSSKSDIIKNKIKQFNLKKYGVEYSWQSEIIKNKIKNTNLKKYGVKNAACNEIIKNKIKESVNKAYSERYDEIIEKIKNSNLLNHGVEFPFKNKKIYNKFKKTLMNRYGIDNLMKNDIFKEKQLIKMKEYWDDELNKIAQRERQINNLKKRQYGKISKPEQIVIDQLNDCNEEYVFQHEVCGYLFDFYIPRMNLLIEVDGDYWHCNPSKYNTPLNDIQKNNIKRDLIKNDVAKNNKFKLKRIYESLIKTKEFKIKDYLT